jgi:tetratricopeptide (TPR) repeat protein
MTRSFLTAAAAVAACVPTTPPVGVRNPFPSDFKVCYLRALEYRESDGRLMVQSYVRPDGVITGAWVRSSNVGDELLERCIVSYAVEQWRYDDRGSDFYDYYGPISFTATSTSGEKIPSVHLPDTSTLKPENLGPLDPTVARRSLQIAPWATEADRGWIEYALADFKAAEAQFRKEIATDPKSVSAWRGLAQSLVASGGDLKEARAAADKAVELGPEVAGAHEALSRVCLAQADLDCAADHFNAATRLDPRGVRGYELAPLQAQLKKADAEDRARRDPEIAGQLAKGVEQVFSSSPCEMVQDFVKALVEADALVKDIKLQYPQPKKDKSGPERMVRMLREKAGYIQKIADFVGSDAANLKKALDPMHSMEKALYAQPIAAAGREVAKTVEDRLALTERFSAGWSTLKTETESYATTVDGLFLGGKAALAESFKSFKLTRDAPAVVESCRKDYEPLKQAALERIAALRKAAGVQ